MNNPIRKIHIIIILMILVILSLGNPCMALEVETHKAINKYIADKNRVFNVFSLHQYLQNNLGIQGGTETYIKKDQLNQQIFDWIADGGEYEDEPPLCIPYWRARNHFHNPINNSGFSGIWDTGFLSGMSVITWSMQPVNSQSCGYYSWNDARDYYYKALTSTDQAARETNFAQTFRGLGQLMHLVQDISVPEHVRNNSHIFGSDYEKWVDKPGNRGPLAGYSAVYYGPDPSLPLNLEELFDTEQYNGTNPDVTLNSNIGLSEYTSANFLSPDTIFNNPDIPYPAYSQTELNRSITGNLYLKKKGYGDANGSGERINHLARAQNLYNYLPADYKKLALTVKDPLVFQEYASKLIPRAIGYSSQALSYFFRGKIDLIKNPDNPSGYVIVNKTGEEMDGGFAVYYDDTNNQRQQLWSGNFLIGANGKSGNIDLPMPADAKEPNKYMLVFKGRLGSEMNAVVGKYNGYWEPWNGPDVDSQNPWEIYNWPESGNGATWEITADPLAPEERPKVLHFNVTGVYPYGSYSLLATNGGTGGILPLDQPIPIDSNKKLFFNIRSLKSGSGFSQGNLYVVDSNGIGKQWYFNGYESYQGAPSFNHPVWIGDNDGTVGLDLSPLSGSIIYFQFEIGAVSGVTLDLWSDFIDIRQVSQ